VAAGGGGGAPLYVDPNSKEQISAATNDMASGGGDNANDVYTYTDGNQPAIYDGAKGTYASPSATQPAIYDGAKDKANGAPVYSVYTGSSIPSEQATYVEPNAKHTPAATNGTGNAPLYSVPMEKEVGGGPVKMLEVYGTTEEDNSVYNAPGAAPPVATGADYRTPAHPAQVGADYRVPTTAGHSDVNGGAMYAATEDSYMYTTAAASAAQGGLALYSANDGEGYLGVAGASSNNTAVYMQNDALYN
jgi:hypothetical protein